MVAKTPMKEKRMAVSLNPNIVRETVMKVDRCMARLQELQYTVTGGTKVVAGVSLSPRTTRGYLRTSLRCKQESIRMKNGIARKSPPGKIPASTNGEWRRMSLPAMLLGETVVEILQASQFAKDIVVAASKLPNSRTPTDPKTPNTTRRSRFHCEGTEMRARRAREKERLRRTIHSESDSPALTKARSRISFKSNSSPLGRRSTRPSVAAHRASPKNRPWAKKAVLFPNPLFLPSSPSSHKQKFYKTRSPIISRARQQTTPHKFLIKSPSASLKSQLKSMRGAVPSTTVSPPPTEKALMPRPRRCSFSPSKLANRLVSPLRSKMVSPLKNRVVSLRRNSGMMSGLKQRPNLGTPVWPSGARKF